MSATAQFPALLSPLDVGRVKLRNRVVSTSHQTSLVHDHLPTADLLAYHEARARGGVGAIFLEATAVDASGLLTSHTIGGFLPEIVASYRSLSERLHEHDARLFVQLIHGGREQIASAPRAPAVAPSAVPSQRFKAEPRAMTRTEIHELIEGYATSARLAADGGVDGIEISMSHGYLPAQFFSPAVNRREDDYGGTIEARMRFAIEVLEATRAAVAPALAVGARLSADELTPGGLDLEACAEIARRLQAAGLVDFISLVLGNSAEPAASTWIAPPPPVPADAIADPARRIRAVLPSATLIATTRVLTLESAERLVADGTADLVGMTRALIADPELIHKTVSARAADVIECIGCNQSCIGHYHAGLPIGCAVNPRTGRERRLRAVPRSDGRRVLVIGAGPAGLSAALGAAGAGAAVRIVEREREIGGQLRLAGLAPAHGETWERYRRSTLARLQAAGLSVEHGVSGSAELAADFDQVVLASGARPHLPASLPADRPLVQAWDVIADPATVPSPALVADWGGGWDGLDAAERLAGTGVRVTLACAGLMPGETLHQYQRNLYLSRLDELGVEILHHVELAAGPDREAMLRHLFSGRRWPLPAVATLVIAQGRAPADELWGELQAHPHAVRVGDVLGPRTIEEAVLEGALAFAELIA